MLLAFETRKPGRHASRVVTNPGLGTASSVLNPGSVTVVKIGREIGELHDGAVVGRHQAAINFSGGAGRARKHAHFIHQTAPVLGTSAGPLPKMNCGLAGDKAFQRDPMFAGLIRNAVENSVEAKAVAPRQGDVLPVVSWWHCCHPDVLPRCARF